MSTPVFLTNATINLTQGGTTTNLSSMSNSVALTIGQESLDVTAFGDTGRRSVGGLQSVDVAITMYLTYGTSEVEAVLASCVGTGTTTLVISPNGATESASNPEYTITNCMLANFTPVNSKVGEISVVECSFVNGTWARDITAP